MNHHREGYHVIHLARIETMLLNVLSIVKVNSEY
jgi:hypothetical protein